jgi:hypothetical protein
VQACVVDAAIRDARQHLDAARLQAGAMDPAGGLAQPVAPL